MKITFATPTVPKAGALAVVAFEGATLSQGGTELDAAIGGFLARAVAANKTFKGKPGQAVTVLTPPGMDVNRVLVLGAGKADGLARKDLEHLGGALLAALAGAGEKEGAIDLRGVSGRDMTAEDVAVAVALGARLRSYRFDKYRTKKKDDDGNGPDRLTVLTEAAKPAKKAFEAADAVAAGVFLTRDLVSEPANVLYPEVFADRAREELEPLGVEVEIFDEKKMRKLGMGALLGVGQGSARDSRLVVMQWKGGEEGTKPLAFIGKGVTFDTGGISLKPGAGMWDMKWDMGGAGVVTGLMKALAGRKAKVNVVGVIGLVENMPSGEAQRPGDVVTSLSGQTIEVLNTDAEGRLVLADALWYTQDRFKPQFMVDLATLTGAILIALGTEYAGLFANDEGLAAKLAEAGESVGEKVWRMPLSEGYDRAIDSDIADVKNIAGDRNAGSSIAAVFLQRFVNKQPWAHLDIAGVTWAGKASAVAPKGATAFGVRLLDRFVAAGYEG